MATPRSRSELVEDARATAKRFNDAGLRGAVSDLLTALADALEAGDPREQWAVRMHLSGPDRDPYFERMHDRAAAERYLATAPSWARPEMNPVIVSRTVTETEWTEAA